MNVRFIGPSELLALAAHPRIRPHIGDGPVEDILRIYDNGIAIGAEGVAGAVVFDHTGGGVFEGHFLFPPESWGGPALEAARAARDWLFTCGPVRSIQGNTLASNRAALAFAAKLGCMPVGTATDRTGAECVLTELTREQWAKAYLADHPAAVPAAM